jgi:glycosyltransferase involved in cell wall biosynthesis
MIPAKNLLVVAYHFPPIQGSSGYLRTLKFVRYLPESGIRPVVLTVNPRAYAASDPGLLRQIPPGIEVHRVFALDTAKHLAYRGRYPSFLSVPDRYWSWIPAGLAAGWRLASKKRLNAIFSTYPVPSAHAIGLGLARLTGLPWVADFRDPMWDPAWHDYDCGISLPELRARRWLEVRVVERATAITCTTDTMADMFRLRYPRQAEKFNVIPNGFDEADFQGITANDRTDGPLTLIHAGLLDPIDRDAVPFFKGLALAFERGLDRSRLKVDLIAPGIGPLLVPEIERLGLGDVVKILDAIPYRAALETMAASGALLLFQGPSCDRQIPAKLYEYLRIGRPILALTTREGETGKLVESTGGGEVVAWNDPERIASALARWVEGYARGTLPRADRRTADAFSRQNQAGRLGRLVDAALARR